MHFSRFRSVTITRASFQMNLSTPRHGAWNEACAVPYSDRFVIHQLVLFADSRVKHLIERALFNPINWSTRRRGEYVPILETDVEPQRRQFVESASFLLGEILRHGDQLVNIPTLVVGYIIPKQASANVRSFGVAAGKYPTFASNVLIRETSWNACHHA